jgi:hypothetical protein
MNLIAVLTATFWGVLTGLRYQDEGLLHIVNYVVPQIEPDGPNAEFSTERVFQAKAAGYVWRRYRKEVYLRDSSRAQEDRPGHDHRKHVLARDDTCQMSRALQEQEPPRRKAVTYTDVNHLACDSCHTSASHAEVIVCSP